MGEPDKTGSTTAAIEYGGCAARTQTLYTHTHTHTTTMRNANRNRNDTHRDENATDRFSLYPEDWLVVWIVSTRTANPFICCACGSNKGHKSGAKEAVKRRRLLLLRMCVVRDDDDGALPLLACSDFVKQPEEEEEEERRRTTATKYKYYTTTTIHTKYDRQEDRQPFSLCVRCSLSFDWRQHVLFTWQLQDWVLTFSLLFQQPPYFIETSAPSQVLIALSPHLSHLSLFFHTSLRFLALH